MTSGSGSQNAGRFREEGERRKDKDKGAGAEYHRDTTELRMGPGKKGKEGRETGQRKGKRLKNVEGVV